MTKNGEEKQSDAPTSFGSALLRDCDRKAVEVAPREVPRLEDVCKAEQEARAAPMDKETTRVNKTLMILS